MKLRKSIGLTLILIILLVTTEVGLADNSTNTGFAMWPFTKQRSHPSPSQIIFLPAGFHFGHTHDVNNEQWLIALNYSGFIGGTFINSANRRVYFGGLERQIYKGERLSIDYLIGVMQGYKGEGLDHLGPVLGHDPGPLVAFTANWSLTKNIAINVATYGVGALGGVSIFY